MFPYRIPKEQITPDYLIRMQEHQTEMLRKATRLQHAQNTKRLQQNDMTSKTVFSIDSYVLVKPEVSLTNKLAPPWLGPCLIADRFERREGDVHRCLHLSTNKEFDFRVDRLNPFYFDDDDANLHQTAQLDYEQYEVEAVLNHRFTGSHSARTLQLEIKWIGYDDTQWQPFMEGDLNNVDVVHEYLRRNKLSKYIPTKFRP